MSNYFPFSRSSRLVSKRTQVPVFGASGTGKNMHWSTYLRKADGISYAFDAQIGPPSISSTDDSEDALKSRSLAVITVDAQDWQPGFKETFNAALETCIGVVIVITKVDLARPYSLDYFKIKPKLAWWYDVDSITVDLHSGEGLQEVMEYITDWHSAESSETAEPTLSEQRPLRSFLDVWCSTALDRIAAMFALPARNNPPPDIQEELSDLNLDTYKDVHKLMASPYCVAWEKELLRRIGMPDARGSGSIRISENLLAKDGADNVERDTMDFVRQNTSIPVPRTHNTKSGYLIMDYIEGEMLLECWDKLSRFMRFRVACTLRLYLKQLRSLTHHTVGRTKDGVMNHDFFTGHTDSETQGPFESASQFRQYGEYKAIYGWTRIMRFNPLSNAPFPRPDMVDWTPVFIHGDLNNSNVLLDKTNTLWLIDFERSGFYPSRLESLAMREYDVFDSGGWAPRKKGIPSRNFIAGATSKEEADFFSYFRTGVNYS